MLAEKHAWRIFDFEGGRCRRPLGFKRLNGISSDSFVYIHVMTIVRPPSLDQKHPKLREWLGKVISRDYLWFHFSKFAVSVYSHKRIDILHESYGTITACYILGYNRVTRQGYTPMVGRMLSTTCASTCCPILAAALPHCRTYHQHADEHASLGRIASPRRKQRSSLQSSNCGRIQNSSFETATSLQ